MGADLHIHVYEGLTELDLKIFFSSSLGSRWFSPALARVKYDSGVYDKIWGTPNVWIGEVSWLKAALFDAEEEFVPSPVMAINRLVGEGLPVLDHALAEAIIDALKSLPNRTDYRIAEPEKVRPFLEQHLGKQLFTVSW